MSKQKHTAEQSIGKLREAEVLRAKGMPLAESCVKKGISDATYYKWRKVHTTSPGRCQASATHGLSITIFLDTILPYSPRRSSYKPRNSQLLT